MLRYALVLLLCCAGCGLTESGPVQPNDERHDEPSVVVVKSPSEAYWIGLANRIDRKLVSTPQELAKIARQLQLQGELTDADMATLEGVFPSAATDTRPLTKADSDKLRSLK